MKIALINDTHAGCRSDSPVFLKHSISFFHQQFFPYIKENNINTVIHLGDVFDRRKYINIKTLNTWKNEVFDIFEQMNLKVHYMLGNHDIYYKDTVAINSFEILKSYKHAHLYENIEVVEFGNLPILFIPWQCQEQNILDAIKNTTAHICMGHLEIKNFSMFPGQVNKEHGIDPDEFYSLLKIYSGHFHHKSDNGHIYYLGTQYEQCWADYNDPKGFHIFDTETKDIDFIQNPDKIHVKLFHGIDEIPESLEDKIIKIYVNKNDADSTLYIDEVTKRNPFSISVIDQSFVNIEEDENIETKDTLTILTEAVESIKSIQNKEAIKNIFYELYQESLIFEE